MLPKSLRLGGRGVVEAVFQARKAVNGAEISLFFRKAQQGQPRVGFAFKQKAFPRSNKRHFLKRKGSAIMRELFPSLPQGVDIVVLFHHPLPMPIEYQTLRAKLVDLIKRLNQGKK